MDVTKAAKKKEVRRQGKPSQTRRPIEIKEFRLILGLCMAVGEDDQNLLYFLPSFLSANFT
jgi:hypothetical protein